MGKVFVLVVTKSGEEDEVSEEILGIPKVVNIERVFGTYDMIVQLEIPERWSPDETVRYIKMVKGVSGVLVLVGSE